jgi:tetratricopeptide (TPR) repeat protein
VFGVFGFVIAKGKIKEFDGLNEEAKNILEQIKQSSIQAKIHEKSTKISAETAKELSNPEAKLTDKNQTEINESGSRIDKIFAEMNKLNSEQKYEEAIVLCNEVIIIAKYEQDNNQLGTGYFYLGYIYGQLKQYKQAINAYKQAIKIKPDNHIAYYNMGVAYGELKQYKQAINAYKQAINIKPDNHIAYYNMGVAYGKLKQYKKAIETYQQVIKINPNYDSAYNNMGVAYGELGEYQSAIKAYRQAININPDDSAYNNMGADYGKLKQYQQAIESYKQAIKIKPDYHNAYINIFETRLITGKPFDVDLAQKFTQFDDELAMMAFDILKTFKNIESNNINKNWQTEFSHKYPNKNFRDWIWKEIETWIKNKEKESDKTELQSALEFFKSFNQSKK